MGGAVHRLVTQNTCYARAGNSRTARSIFSRKVAKNWGSCSNSVTRQLIGVIRPRGSSGCDVNGVSTIIFSAFRDFEGYRGSRNTKQKQVVFLRFRIHSLDHGVLHGRPAKNRWKVTASSGDPRLAIDDNYATTWILKPSKKPWLEVDLGEVTTLGGLEVYWGKQAAGAYGFESSLDGKTWAHLCRTRHGEGGQDVFAFPPAAARFVRWTCDNPEPERGQEIVQINLYGPADAASVLEEGRVAALGHAPVKLRHR